MASESQLLVANNHPDGTRGIEVRLADTEQALVRLVLDLDLLLFLFLLLDNFSYHFRFLLLFRLLVGAVLLVLNSECLGLGFHLLGNLFALSRLDHDLLLAIACSHH